MFEKKLNDYNSSNARKYYLEYKIQGKNVDRR